MVPNERRTYAVYINGRMAASFTSRKSALDFLDGIKETGTAIKWGFYTNNNPNQFNPLEEYTVNRFR